MSKSVENIMEKINLYVAEKKIEHLKNFVLRDELASIELIELIIEIENRYQVIMKDLDFAKLTFRSLIDKINEGIKEQEEYKKSVSQIQREIFDEDI